MKKPFYSVPCPFAAGIRQRAQLLVALMGLAPAAFAQSSFSFPSVYPTGGGSPLGVALGDVNGDTRLDVVTANQSSDNVSVFLGAGGTMGSLAPALTYSPGGLRPTGVALGDVNGDGRPDIITGNQSSNTVGVMLNSATSPGSFLPATSYPSGGTAPNIVALGDLNGDGRTDIAVGNTGSSAVGVLLGSAATPGTFLPAATYPSGSSSPVGIAIGDVNADGKPDLVLGHNSGNTVSVLLNSAAVPGTFGSPAVYNSGGTGTVGISLGDVNGDGRVDIVAANATSSSVAVLLGQSGTLGTFGPATVYNSGGIGPNFALLSDVNGDGRPDIVTANNSSNGAGSVGVLTGLAAPAGTFAPATVFSSGGNGPIGIALGDINGDGRRDVVTTNYISGTVAVLLNTYTPLATALAQSTAEVFVYPNPAHGTFEVQVPGVADAQAVQAELLNTLGQVVYRQPAFLPPSGTHVIIDAAGLAPGVYTLRLQAGSTAMSRRVVLH
ncbi:FG-GAP-like repeat-containing protein [Hymenobacter rubidus]|uniref:FG-GAP-like repeat-containing protein n=1 Tax=Hymenobacter rubidus TaxID=1441626 RepID=UPI00192004D0|nr:FG-GAP-like repeat-containing protein [Hymenobacter rubidus]